MQSELFASAMSKAEACNLSVLDLIHTVETLKKTDGLDAVKQLFETWTTHNQDNSLLYAVLFNYSVILTDSGDLERARECLEKAISLNAEFMPAYINLGRVFERLGSTSQAVTQWSKVLEGLAQINGSAITHKTTALNQTARVLEAANQDEPAGNMLRQSVEIDITQKEPVQHLLALRQRLCEWPIVFPWERVSRSVLMTGISPLSAAAYTDDPMLHLATAWNYNKYDTGSPPGGIVQSHWAAREGRSGPLRIGYLSSDLREHAVGHLVAEILELHDASAVETFAYYCGPKATDVLHERFKASAGHWIDVGEMSDADAARRIADDGIQILVDLNGYTREGRLKLVAMRPAPVIVNWLGYPGTMGSPYHHYIVADDCIIPQDHEIYYSEKVLRLPCYQPNDRKRVVSERQPQRSDAGLPENETVFCCFNGVHKINRFTLERWLTILSRVPGSVMWLLGSNDTVQERLRKFAAAHGIAPERLVFAAKLANPDHLARYPLADLFLDTTPYGAHTTASDALWMGVPVLTLSGRSFASRVCGSLVHAAGTPEMSCATPEEYVDRAVALGRDPARTRQYRERLLASRDSCTLFDTPLLVRSMEALYAQMWQEFEAGNLPQPDLTNLDVYLEVGIEPDHDAVEVQAIKDYRAWWLERLSRRHAIRPLAPDHRFFTEADIKAARRAR